MPAGEFLKEINLDDFREYVLVGSHRDILHEFNLYRSQGIRNQMIKYDGRSEIHWSFSIPPVVHFASDFFDSYRLLQIIRHRVVFRGEWAWKTSWHNPVVYRPVHL